MSLRLDVVIIGAGPAGLTAAYLLAKAGLKVAVLERGRRPGSKNLYGGRVYLSDLEPVVPDLVKNMPRGRLVKREVLMLTSDEGFLTVALEFPDGFRNGNIVSLTRLSEWLAEQVEAVGGYVVTCARVDSIVVRDGQAQAVICGPDRIEADIIVNAEGVNRILLEQLGLTRLRLEEVALGVKEVYRVDPSLINVMFDLQEDEGLALFAVGKVLDYVPGGVFMYTDKNYVHIGYVAYLKYYTRINKTAPEVLQRIYELPEIRRVVKSGERVEYGARLVTVAPVEFNPVPLDRLVVIGEAGGFTLHIGPLIRGVDYAMISGACAAKAITDVLASERKITRRELHDKFIAYLKQTPFMQDLELFRKVHELYSEERLFNNYVRLLVSFMREYLTVSGPVKGLARAFEMACQRAGVGFWGLMRDYLKMFRRM